MAQSNGASYDAIAAKWAADRADSHPDDLVVAFAKSLKTGSRVLDIGCGSGKPNTEYLTKTGMEGVGIDVSAKLLAIAKQNVPSAIFVQKSITDYESNVSFDGVIAWDSLFHLGIDEHETAFRKIYDLLNHGGMFVFTHGGSEGEIFGEMHDQPFTYSSLGPEKTKQLLESIGFRLIKWLIDKSEKNGYLKALVQK